MADFDFIFTAFPTAAALARALGEKQVTVRKWRNRDSIPPQHWDALIALARRRRLRGVTRHRLHEAYSARWRGEPR